MLVDFKVETKTKGEYYIYLINGLEYTNEYTTEEEAYNAGLLNLIKVIKSKLK